MRGKKILIVLLLIILLVLLLSRCGGGKDAPELPEDSEMQRAENVTPVKEHALGTVEALDGGGVSITVTDGGNTTVYSFSDVQADDWYMEAVNFMLSNGLMNGMTTADGREAFQPDYGMTRAQLAMILYRFMDGEPVSAGREYTDVPESEWYYDCVNWAVENGYIVPGEADRFGADEFCSCEEVLTILHRLAGSPRAAATLEDYLYAPKVSEDGAEAVRWALEKGLIAEDACVWYPTQAVSRAQIALLFMRYNHFVGVTA